MREDNQEYFTVSISERISTDFIDTIMCNALEGGINYWCEGIDVVNEDYKGAAYGHEVIARGGELILHDMESDDTWRLTRDKILKGIELYILNNGFLIEEDIDGEVADCIVQYALFREVQFG